MKYHCSTCGYMYDEFKGEESLNIAPQTPFHALPSDFFCPHCDTHKDDFIVFEEEIHMPFDAQNLTSLESAHMPTFHIWQDTLQYSFEENEMEKNYHEYIYQISLHDENGEHIQTHTFSDSLEKKGTFDLEYVDIFELRVYSYQYGIFSSWPQENIPQKT